MENIRKFRGNEECNRFDETFSIMVIQSMLDASGGYTIGLTEHLDV